MTDAPDFKVKKYAENADTIYRNGYTVEPITDAGKQVCKIYKGVIMNKFFVPNSMFDGFQSFACSLGAPTIDFVE